MLAGLRNVLPPLRRHPRAFAACASAALLVAVGVPAYRHFAAENSLRAARAALAARDFDGALAHLRACLGRRPRDAGLRLLAARAARRGGHFDEAERYLEECQRLGGATDSTRLEWDLLRVQRGDLEGPEARLRATVGPDHPDALLVLEALAQGFLKRDRLLDAVEALDLWLGREPGAAQALAWRGWALERLGRLRDALRDYRAAVEADPNLRDARLGLARVLLRRNEPSEAAECLAPLAGRHPDDPEVLVALAECRLGQGRAADAVDLLDRVLAGRPRDGRALAARGKAALMADDPAGAEEWLRRAVAEAPDDREALHQLVGCLRRLRRDAEADRHEQRLAAVSRDLRRLDQVVREVARRPHDPAPRREAGRIALRLGNEREALRWLLGALREAPADRDTHLALAEYYERKGDAPRAREHRRLAGGEGR